MQYLSNASEILFDNEYFIVRKNINIPIPENQL